MKRVLILIVAILLLGAVAHAERLRGFGEVELRLEEDGLLTFVCEDVEHARLLMHKLGRDLGQSATVPARWERVQAGSLAVPVLVRPGLGVFLPMTLGRKLVVLTGSVDEAPALAARAVALGDAGFFDPDFRYPAYLDKFSHHGIGSWYPSNWGDKNTQGKPNGVDDHFAFARELDLVLQPNAGGYLLRNLLPKLHEYGRPYHFAKWQEWSQELAIMAPEELIQTGDQFSAMPHYYGQVSDGGKRLMTWHNWKLQDRVRRYGQDPLLIDWPDPNGEVGPFDQDFFWDFTENNRRNFVRFLREIRGYSLASLGEAWHGDGSRFAGWDEVPIPMTYELFGWRADSILADRTWRLHPVAPGQALKEGLAAGFHRDDVDDSGWVSFEAPGGELISTFWRAGKAIWHRGRIEVPQDWLEQKRAAGPIYLNAVTFTNARGFRNPDRVWLNGQEIAAYSHCPGHSLRTQFEITDFLRAGANSIAYLPAHASFYGSFFLTDEPWEVYPFRDSQRNARYADWHEYVPWAVADMLENTYKAIRAVDPDRPIKMHAFQNKHLGISLAARYGAFGHNTGDEAFFRPWDKRFGYVRGVPGSAEPSGSVDSPEHFKRWLGWYSFTGLNALDYFHNIQSMMYSPAAALWKEYLPYWKLAPRRDIKQPQIALMWSSRNNHLLSRPVPYCFDLGRGDLQAIGYSYVYADESTLRDGLVDDYPVLWDTGSFILDEATIADLRRYVEGGGTYVMLQETGRHTTTQRDSWPISDLTGFRVKEVRPMTGSVAIMNEQPVFRKLAGSTWYNRGKSIDYSDYNYADKCIALEPVAEGVTAIARYEDGAIAIGMRELGKGRVIVLGSPFWRDSYDLAGMWWPGESQSAFLEDILDGLGLKPLAAADTHHVWREHYLATNGTEEFLHLHNPGDEPRTFTTEWTTVHPATTLHDPKNGREIPAIIDGTMVRLEGLTLGPRETLILATQPTREPRGAVQDWFAKLGQWWRQSESGEVLERPDLPLYELRLADDLHAKVLTSEEADALPAIPAGTVLGACQSRAAFNDNPDSERRCVFHIAFATPREWRAEDSVLLFIRGMTHAIGNVVGPVDAWVNGTQVLDQADASARGYSSLQGGAEVEIGTLLRRDADNVLVFTTGPNGFHGEVDIQMRPAPAEELEIAGEWQLQAGTASGLSTIELPGAMTGLYAWREFTIPVEWQEDRIFARLELADVRPLNAFAVNGKMIFHPVNWFEPVTYMDVTPWVKPGAANRLTLITTAAVKGWEPGTLHVERVVLQRVKR